MAENTVKPKQPGKRTKTRKTKSSVKTKTRKPKEKSTSARPNLKGKAGRKPLYEVLDIRSKLEAITGWAKQGSTDQELAEMIGVGITTFYEWRKKIPEFYEALKKGKQVANGELINVAFKQSSGFYVVEEVAVKVKDFVTIETAPETADKPAKVRVMEVERVETVPVKRFVNPNAAALIFMMKNRLPNDYKDKVETEVNINGSLATEMSKARERVRNATTGEQADQSGTGTDQ